MFILWQEWSKPRSGPIFDAMRRTRAQFKYALRYCKSVEDQARADSLASKMSNLTDNEFWKELKYINNSKLPASSSIDGVTGRANIVEYWADHYKTLFNSVPSCPSKLLMNKQMVIEDNCIFSVHEIELRNVIRT